MTDSEAELREQIDDIVGDARNEAYQAGGNDTNMDLHNYTEDIMRLVANHDQTVEQAARLSENRQAQEIVSRYWKTTEMLSALRARNGGIQTNQPGEGEG